MPVKLMPAPDVKQGGSYQLDKTGTPKRTRQPNQSAPTIEGKQTTPKTKTEK